MASVYNLWKLHDVMRSREHTITWLHSIQILPKSRNCPRCRNPMKIHYRTVGEGLGYFLCTKKHYRGVKNVKRSISENTWFENCHCGPEIAIILAYGFSRQMTFQQIICESSITDGVTSTETVNNWYSYCREVCMLVLDDVYDTKGKIGGPGIIVEVDEMKVEKSKCKKGQIKEGQLILGMIVESQDYSGDDFRMEICPESKQDAATFLRAIEKHILPGTTVVTDCWHKYKDELVLTDGTHFMANSDLSVNFVDPETLTKTSKIQSNWRSLKKRLSRGGIPHENMASHLCEYLWRRRVKKMGVDPFSEFLKDLKTVYPGK